MRHVIVEAVHLRRCIVPSFRMPREILQRLFGQTMCGASVLSQKDAVPWVPDSFQVSGHDDVSAEGASSSRFGLLVQSLYAAPCTIVGMLAVHCSSRLLEVTSHVYPFFQVGFLNRIAVWNPKWFPLADPTPHEGIRSKKNARLPIRELT